MVMWRPQHVDWHVEAFQSTRKSPSGHPRIRIGASTPFFALQGGLSDHIQRLSVVSGRSGGIGRDHLSNATIAASTLPAL